MDNDNIPNQFLSSLPLLLNNTMCGLTNNITLEGDLNTNLNNHW